MQGAGVPAHGNDEILMMRRRSLDRQRQTARVAAHCSGRRSLGATLATSPWPSPLMDGPLRALRINRLAMLRFARSPVQYPPRVQSRNSRRTVEGFDDSVMLNSTLTRGCQSYPTEPPARHSRSALPSASARASASLRKIALSCCPLWGSFASFSASPLHVRLAPDTFHEKGHAGRQRGARSETWHLFDHLVGAGQKRFGDRQSDRLGGR